MKQKNRKQQKPLKQRQKGFARFDASQTPNPTSIEIRPRLINVCKIYNISTETLIAFLKAKGYKNLTNTTLFKDDTLALIEKEFTSQKNIKDIIRGETNVTFVSSENKSESIASPGNASQYQVLYLDKNIFEKKKTEMSYKELPLISPYFSDIEAINLCSKMSSSFARNVCNQLNNPKQNKKLLLYQIHAIANKALKLFGGKMLTFIYQLKNLQFKNKTAVEVKTYDKVIPDFPMISFVSNKASFKISFFLKRNRQTNKLQADIRLFEHEKHIEVGSIDEHGYVLTRLEKFKPQLNLFYEAQLNKEIKIYSGVETGNCDLCGKELTHPTSLRLGIGPTCAKNHNVDASLYSYN